jgi:hypothetical protein
VHFLHDEAVLETVDVALQKVLVGANESRTFFARSVLTADVGPGRASGPPLPAVPQSAAAAPAGAAAVAAVAAVAHGPAAHVALVASDEAAVPEQPQGARSRPPRHRAARTARTGSAHGARFIHRTFSVRVSAWSQSTAYRRARGPLWRSWR